MMLKPRIFDISVSISEDLPVWPGDPSVEINLDSSILQGSLANISSIKFGLHSGTHIDAPFHFIQNGAKLDQIALERLTGPALVIEISGSNNMISRKTLEDLNLNSWPARILFKTRNSSFWQNKPHYFQKDFCALDLSAAQFLVAKGVRLIGIDYLSVAPYADPLPVHKELLRNEIIILESIDLNAIEPGLYELVCLPLKLINTEAAPARAILIKSG